jgi:hypothetical protein
MSVAYGVFALATVCAACSGGGAPSAAPGQAASPTPSPVYVAPTAPAGKSEVVELPSPGVLFRFPSFNGSSGAFVLPSYKAAAGTFATFSTRPGSGLGPAPETRRRGAAAAVSPSAVMSLEMSFSQNVTFSELPVTVFSPASGSGNGANAIEVFDDITGTLLFAALQGEAPNGVIGFSSNGGYYTSTHGSIAALGGHTYSLELVQNTALALPSPGPVCGSPVPVPFPAFTLASPAPSATGVPTTIGSLLLQGNPNYYYGPITVSVTDSADGTVIVKAASPSPAPSPIVTGEPYSTVPLPQLSAETKYSVKANVPNYGSTPPVCRSVFELGLGSFATGP